MLKKIKAGEAILAVEDLIEFYDKLNIVKARETAMETGQIAIAQNIAIYDALFIAITQKVNGSLLTADRRLHVVAQKVTDSTLLA